MTNSTFKIRLIPFEQLDLQMLYDILAMRNRVFIVEQNCPYQDIDYEDQSALHLLIHDKDPLIAYARVFINETEKKASFGRVLTAPSHRGKKISKQLLQFLMNYFNKHCPSYDISISAQYYLLDFYRSFGFIEQGKSYDLDGIQHVDMVKPHE
ncbi:GNAT family N-acetyltransferase [Legionella israelensis]|uniref:GNAT family N-acetyltransferase n=1 Tax=Legionella israelensis TaxID=454 RepID=A0AAX1EHG2_9GAMM|nr:GNAT family N-acetyltransferase [Legionella israelensis]QBR84626.1 GNAT family N-acetyltransferase [Legionella israelensis]